MKCLQKCILRRPPASQKYCVPTIPELLGDAQHVPVAVTAGLLARPAHQPPRPRPPDPASRQLVLGQAEPVPAAPPPAAGGDGSRVDRSEEVGLSAGSM